MAYTTTAKEFLTSGAGALLAVAKGLDALIKVDVTNVGTWWLDFANKRVSTEQPAGKKPKVIVRAFEGDFMALVEGRMSVADGLESGRLHLAGDAASLARLGDVIAKLTAH